MKSKDGFKKFMNYKNWMQQTKNTLIYISILFFVKLLRIMNRNMSIAFMRYVGRLAYLLAKNERENTHKNLNRAFGDMKSSAEIRQLAKNVFLTLSACAADAVRLPNLVKNGSIDDLVSVDNFHYLSDAIAQGKGVIIMTGHYGNWELMGTWVVRKGFPIKVIAKKSYDPRLDKMIVGYRNQAGYANTARGNASKSIIEGLLNGDVYGMLFDLDTKVKGVFVDFFGRPAHTATAPAILSQKIGSPIIPMFIRLKKDFTYKITCLEPLKLVDTGDDIKDAVTNTQICSDVYEKMIRRHPEQWIWMHSRWKKKPNQVS